MVTAGSPFGPTTPTIAIVGLGPKGLYCLERLVAEFAAHPSHDGVHIAVFNRTSTFGVSPIYDPAEPPYLLVNNSVGDIDLWGVGDPPTPAGRGPNFVAWYQEEFQPVRPITGDEYLSRAVVGRHLHDGFARVASHLPSGVALSCFRREVIDIVPNVDGYVVVSVDAEGDRHELPAEKILLATGHSPVQPTSEERSYSAFAARHAPASFIPFVYPVATLRDIPPGGRVAMKGIGLTFIDALLALTEGRGGSFERQPNGCLSYRRSGREPQAILPFSRSGLPMAPKPQDLPHTLRPLTFVTPRRLAELQRSSKEGKIDFERDLWPLVELEMELQYYRVEMGHGPARHRLEACAGDAEAMRRAIDSFLESDPDRVRFDCGAVLDPVAGRSFATGAEFDSFVARYLQQEIARARLGLAASGVKAAIAIWYEVRTALSPFMAFGGLTPPSHRRLMQWYHPRLKRVVFGPPIISIEKLLALQKAGIVDFSVARRPQVLADEARSCFELRSESIPGASTQAQILVDARYPPVDIARDATPLFSSLRSRGMVRAFENQSHETHSTYRPGAIDMTAGRQFVIDARGVANQDLAVIGIPTEGNLLGNLSVTRDDFAGIWAAEVRRQLQSRELSPNPVACWPDQ